MAGLLARRRARRELERSFLQEARISAYQDLKQHKFSYHYITMIDAYVRSYCRTKAQAITKSHDV